MMEEKEKKFFMIGMGVLLLIVLLFGGTYAWLTLQLKGTKVNVLKAGNLSLILDDINSIGINQEKAVPTLDEVGETFDPYHFTLENLGTTVTNYTIYLDDLDLEEGEERMEDEYLRYSLVKDGEKRKDALTTLGVHPERVLDNGVIEGGQKIVYDLRLWMDIAAGNEAMGKVFRSKIRVIAMQKEEKDCYVFNKETKEITDYLCYEGNSSGLSPMTEVTIPDTIDGVTVEKIGARAFSFKNITSVTIPEGVTTIGDYAFLSNELSGIRLPNTITAIGKAAFNDNKLSDNEAFIYKRNGDGTNDSTTVVSYGGAKRTNVIVPASVQTIDAFAMAYNNLISVGIQEGVTSIKESAFFNNGLMNVVIPSTVTSIESNAFLKSSESNPNLSTIANHTGISFDFGGITGSSSQSFATGVVTHASGNVTVTIQNKVYIQYHMNGGSLAASHGSSISVSGSLITSGGSTTVTTIAYGTPGDLANYNNASFINLTRTGYKIESSKVWNTAPDGSGKNFDQTTAYSTSDFCDVSKKDCTITLYANWVPTKLYIRYHVNGGSLASSHGSNISVSGSLITNGGSTNVTTMTYGSSLDLQDYNNASFINLTRTGYKIESDKVWNTASNGSGKNFNQTTAYPASDFCDISYSDCTVTLYANWVKANNPNIVAVYQYNATSCLTGEESTCVNIGPQTTYTAGTIIKYKVNASTQKYFHVMFDNGTTLTMQQRENTVDSVAWYETSRYDKYNTKGPTAAIAALESATSGWTNVNNQTYTMGTTVFKTNAYTGCVDGCTKNTYTWSERTARARMITYQEAHALGCTGRNVCPIWMLNYLAGSTNIGGTVNYGTSFNYWTMSANSSSSAGTKDYVFAAIYNSSNSVALHASTGYEATKLGARAVVVINKQ